MKKLFGIMLVALVAWGCKPPQSKIDKTILKAKVDSLAAIQLDSINRTINNECAQRLSTDVYRVADSIVNAKTNAK